MQPPALAAELADLRVHPAEIEGALIQVLIPRAAELDQSDPAVRRRLAFLAARLAELLGTHAVATELLATRDWDFGAVYYECIDQVRDTSSCRSTRRGCRKSGSRTSSGTAT